MKRVIAACFILSFLITACFLSYNYIDKTTNTLSEHLQKASKAITQNDFLSANEQMQKVYNHWSESSSKLSSLCRHNEIDDIERLFQRANQAVLNWDKNDSLVQIKELNMMLLHLPEMEKACLSNIL